MVADGYSSKIILFPAGHKRRVSVYDPVDSGTRRGYRHSVVESSKKIPAACPIRGTLCVGGVIAILMFLLFWF